MRKIFQETMSLLQHIKAITMEAATYKSYPKDPGAPANVIMSALETHPIDLQTGWRRLLRMFERYYVTEGPMEFPIFTERFLGQEIAYSMIFSGQTQTKWAKFLKEFWVLSQFTRDYGCPITINPDSTICISSTFANGIQPNEHAGAADSGELLGSEEKDRTSQTLQKINIQYICEAPRRLLLQACGGTVWADFRPYSNRGLDALRDSTDKTLVEGDDNEHKTVNTSRCEPDRRVHETRGSPDGCATRHNQLAKSTIKKASPEDITAFIENICCVPLHNIVATKQWKHSIKFRFITPTDKVAKEDNIQYH
ncbi:hypothetical protein GE061_016960 [Apolygus lucorum]|uniref:Uncharacterized protein n=1 Tax=Apolygus lucorum TaxID=248454 RepID=A0A8S9XHN0_APOLU|nr:hypothetical protein GE061_016960 [Apolygus lucorum]